MDHPYQKRPMKRGQCRHCPEINPKFKDYLLHEATHRVKKEEPPPEVTEEPGKQVINKEADNVDVKQVPIEPLRVSNAVKMGEPTDAGNGESSNSTSKNFRAKLAASRMNTIPAISHVDLDAEIKERIRNYDWTKDFHQAIEKKNGNSRRKVAYICKICSSSNVRKDRLLLHTFIHTGERPFHCKICPKTFTFPHAREAHEIIHTGKQPFKCHKCSQDFTSSCQLSRHKKSHFSKMKHKKNAQTRIKANVKGGVTRDVILCLDRVDQVNEHSHLYSQALKRLNSSLPEEIQEDIGTRNGMDLDALAAIMCPELPYKCILCSERFGDPMELCKHRKIHISNGVGPRNDTPQKDEHEIRLTRSKAKNNIESKSNEIEIPVNSLDIIMQTQTHAQPVDPNGSDESLDEATHTEEATLSIPTPKMIFGPRLPIRRRMDLRVRKSTNSENLQVDLDAQIKERIRSYNWTKDFRKICTKDGKVAYKCKICSFRHIGLWKHHLLHHTFVHSGERPYQCGQCLKTFKNSIDRKRHEIIHTRKQVNEEADNVNIRKTPIGPLRDSNVKMDESPDAGVLGESSLTPSKNFGLAVSRIISTKSHMDLDAEIRERIRNYDWTKDFHQAIEKNDANSCRKVAYICKICSSSNVRKDRLLLHTFVHTGERPFHCKICPKTFTFPRARLMHEIIHTGLQPYKCSQCSKCFTSSSHLSRHMKSYCPKGIKNSKTNPFPIKNEILQEIPKTPDFSACLKFGCSQKLIISLYRVDKVKEHMDLYNRALERLQNSEMEGVGKNQEPVAFTAKPGKLLKKPVTTESIIMIRKYFKKAKDGKFECLQCHQMVKYPTTHRLTHLPSKIPCNICGKNFKTVKNLKLHVKRAHLGIKRNILKVTCRFCDKKMQNCNLKDHEDSHQGIKRHICSKCSKGFTFRSDYGRHLKKHAGNDRGINGRSVQEEPLPLRVQPPEIKKVEAFTEEELLEIDEALSDTYI